MFVFSLFFFCDFHYRCLIENDTELNCGDDQGWTPAHFAAISGGLESLKVLALSDIGVTSRDSAGCVPAHYTAAHDHPPCLMFLVNTGLTKMDVRDRSGRSLLHLVMRKYQGFRFSLPNSLNPV